MRIQPRTTRLAVPDARFAFVTLFLRVFVMLLVVGSAGCGKDDKVLKPVVSGTVSAPFAPDGETSVVQGDQQFYTAEGAVSSAGDTLECRFDFDAAGAHAYSSWSRGFGAATTWATPGTFVVKAQARSVVHPTVVSPWSPGLTVTVRVLEAISTPTAPTGTTVVNRGDVVTYSTGGSTSSLGHSIEYRFQISDPNDVTLETSAWSTSPSVNHPWPAAGTYYVKAEARCSTDTLSTSTWSDAVFVTVNATGTPVIQSATLYLFNSGSVEGPPLVLHEVLGAWDEGALTWGTMPSVSDSLAGSTYASGCIELDCSTSARFTLGNALLQGWLDHTDTNDGLAIGPSVSAAQDVSFGDRTSALYPPYVTIVWSYSDETLQRTKDIPLNLDAYVDETNPASNYGATGTLVAGRAGGGEQVIFVKFDMTLP